MQAPVIVTFHMPTHAAFGFGVFYAGLAQRGYLIYPGKLAAAPSFRVGCIAARSQCCCPPLAAPHPGSCASSARAWWL